MKKRLFVLAFCAAISPHSNLSAAEAISGPLRLTVSNTVKAVTWPRPSIPALETNLLRVGLSVDGLGPISRDSIASSPAGYAWGTTNSTPRMFFSLTQSQMSSNALLSASVLNRLAYGPTPDELQRIATIGPQAYIDEQLAPEFLPNPLDAIVSMTTNAVSIPATSWTTVTVTGLVTTPTLYMYLQAPGQVSVDNVQIRYSHVLTAITNTAGVLTTNVYFNITTNLLINGDFEQSLTTGWTVSSILSGSFIDASTAQSGANSLRMVSTGVGTTQGSAIWQALPAAPANSSTNGVNGATGQLYTNTVSTVRSILTFSYIQNPNSHLLQIRLSGSGIIISGADQPDDPVWIYATATGTATGTPSLYAYLSDVGECWIDDLKLVAGSTAEAGPNLVVNGDFEQPFATGWQATADFVNSYVDNTVARSGAGSLHIVATAPGAGGGDSVFQTVPVTSGQTYTVSYWYRPATRNRTLTVRLSGSQLVSSPDTISGGLRRRLEAADWGVTIDEMRRWYCQNAVAAPGQLLEILTQFFENHFVTYHSKTMDYFDRYYDGGILDRIATDLEYHEVSRWRQALRSPNCNFYDLLKIHVESPAEIIYLDTVESRGDGTRIANENYGRELLELFTMGVDNSYDQNDIVAMSRAWTGWTVDIVSRENINNPFAPRSGQFGFYPGVGFNQVSNIVGVWSFVYNTNWHGANRAPILSVWNPNSPATNPVAIGPKVYPARVGAPWAGRSYQINLPQRTGNAGIQDGYDVAAALATNIFTAEYLSVKLCRIFVHDNFPTPTTKAGLPEYDFYDYTKPNLSPEAALVHRCIVAWDTPGPDGRRGNIRSVLRTIFDSDLFRSHGGSRQKVKTPLEFVISAVRAIRSVNANGSATVVTDGNFASQLGRMGGMSLFNRADPDGYPESGPPWVSAGTLAERLRFVQTLLTAASARTNVNNTANNDAGATTVDPVALLMKTLSTTSQRDPSAVAEYFLRILFPGEGAANLDLYRLGAMNFLNTADDGAPSAFNALAPSNAANSPYDTRVRGMVAMLMTLQRFQEQ